MCRGVATGTTLLALLLATACYGTRRLPLVPSSETRVVGDIRGVVLKEHAGGGRIEFSRVSEVRWTSSELIITGTVVIRDAGSGAVARALIQTGQLRRRGQTTTASFPHEDVSHVLLAEHQYKYLEIGTGIAVGAGLAWGGFVIHLLSRLS